ncbi:GNAT family N-acetyltransferase [Clostridium sp. YIM B02505]|uniref:GNAT family N-acetyltransferase n=1 Tax=Clostridium yunnanense TaxID=2800325 RepID=A0ABS1EVL3_9CLOT|nr:GNAT family N-acetyltransferase [Clostridium yunnanense]MBK1813359.1 GNAT family N-acetyltransferase [Clostridium yunnanense]
MLSHKGTQTLETERLLLHKFKLSDAECMFKNWATDSEVCKFLSWKPQKDLIETKQIVESWVNAYSFDYYNWAIELKSTSEIIGQISLMSLDEKNLSCTTGYNLGRLFWGKGYMMEALNIVIDYLFKEVGINRIEARHNTLNIASGRVMQKSGMRFEGILRQAKINKYGEFYDLAVYSILRSDFKEVIV